MLLLQFSTSHYCRKARLALGFKGISYEVENLTPGLHRFKLKPMTGLSTVPVLLPQQSGLPSAIADSTEIFKFLESYQSEPSLLPAPAQQTAAWMLEDWLDESIGTATRFVYYDFRAGEGKQIDPSWSSQILIQVVRRQYQINSATVNLAKQRIKLALEVLQTWQKQPYLVGESLSVADIAAAALLSPLALIPEYRKEYPWLFSRIQETHEICREPLPPGLK
ncbi:glutathione S-transferase [[Phormidium ambiguum] IAM M-71]|uniref:Glutathione S-transferase n=1 Tax=[Phormidium ambiguum] IAM M-71 TaxID=454136 RepID=A0A1U7I9X4_9CYAN|nr:glutathione S-transferase family protein [Phormidium ambiguum]OKH33353.1 glutathione S-transferase [Phormidium ambiguum IAM M-71]